MKTTKPSILKPSRYFVKTDANALIGELTNHDGYQGAFFQTEYYDIHGHKMKDKQNLYEVSRDLFESVRKKLLLGDCHDAKLFCSRTAVGKPLRPIVWDQRISAIPSQKANRKTAPQKKIFTTGAELLQQMERRFQVPVAER